MTAMTQSCLLCWKEMGSREVCPHCGKRKTLPSNRRSDALPALTLLRDRYLIGEVLGKGGYGITYSVWDTRAQQRVALKELFPNTVVFRESDGITISPVADRAQMFEQIQESFQKECSLLQLLSAQPKMLAVYDQFSSNGTIYYTMEFLDGTDLNTYRKKRGPMSWEEMKPIVGQLLDILERIHGQNLIHRDISPDNIFLIGNNEVRLIDFGAARTYQGATHFTVQKKDDLAPLEQFSRDSNQGPWTDIFSLSATIYLLLTGKLPTKVFDRLAGKPLIALKRLAPNTPDAVAAAVERGLAIDHKERLQSAREFRTALGMGVSPDKVETSGHTTGTRVKKNPRTAQKIQFWLYGRSGVFAGQRRQLPIGRQITLGRGPGNDFSLPNDTKGVSRKQCVLYAAPDNKLYVRDAGSSFGTILNGRRIDTNWELASPGSRIIVGAEEYELVLLLSPGP